MPSTIPLYTQSHPQPITIIKEFTLTCIISLPIWAYQGRSLSHASCGVNTVYGGRNCVVLKPVLLCERTNNNQVFLTVRLVELPRFHTRYPILHALHTCERVHDYAAVPKADLTPGSMQYSRIMALMITDT